MLPEIKDLEPQLKEILYGCVEHIQATKAALYLSASSDLNDKRYELVTSYQYNAVDRKVVGANDDLVDRLAVRRNAFYVNGLREDQRLAEMLFRQGTDRLLAAPIFARGRLVGFIDMRDKAGKKPFDSPDIFQAQKIAESMTALLGSKQLFGLAAIPLVEVSPTPKTNVPRVTVAMPLPATALQPDVFTPAATKAIEAARAVMAKRQLAVGTRPRRVLSENELEVIRLLLPAALAIPGAVLAALTAAGQINVTQSVVAIALVTEDAEEVLQRHLQSWLERMNVRANTTALRPDIFYPFGQQVVPVSVDAITSILSASVNSQSVEGLVLTVAFERTPEAQAQRALQLFLRHIEQSVEAALGASQHRTDRQAVAERLLEPDFQRYPDLIEHSREVSALAYQFGQKLGLAAAQLETVRLAGLVHDVGMRLLDYERIYRKASLSQEEIRGMTEHPCIGAALVEPVLGPDIAQAVLRHHERVDGRGYPSRLSGEQIPLAARIIAICDAWLAITSTQSYRPTASHEEGMKRMREGDGTQFDSALLKQFFEALPEIDPE